MSDPGFLHVSIPAVEKVLPQKTLVPKAILSMQSVLGAVPVKSKPPAVRATSQ